MNHHSKSSVKANHASHVTLKDTTGADLPGFCPRYSHGSSAVGALDKEGYIGKLGLRLAKRRRPRHRQPIRRRRISGIRSVQSVPSLLPSGSVLPLQPSNKEYPSGPLWAAGRYEISTRSRPLSFTESTELVEPDRLRLGPVERGYQRQGHFPQVRLRMDVMSRTCVANETRVQNDSSIPTVTPRKRQ